MGRRLTDWDNAKLSAACTCAGIDMADVFAVDFQPGDKYTAATVVVSYRDHGTRTLLGEPVAQNRTALPWPVDSDSD